MAVAECPITDHLLGTGIQELRNIRLWQQTTTPASPTEGIFWFDSNVGNKRLYFYDGVLASAIAVPRLDRNESWTGQPAFSYAGAPFTVVNSTVVTNLNSHRLADEGGTGRTGSSQHQDVSTVAIRDSGGRLRVATAVNDYDATPLVQVNDLIAGRLGEWGFCKAATTGNVDLANAPATVDGVALSTNDRVLVWQQTSAPANGIYLFTTGTPNTLTRAADADESDEFFNGRTVFVDQGTSYANKTFQTFNLVSGFVLGTNNVDFNIISGAGQISAGKGLVKVGDTLHFAQSTDYTTNALFYAGGVSTVAQVALNATATPKYLRQVSSGVPAFEQVIASEIGSGAALTKVDDTNVTLALGGSPTVALLAATSITVGWTGTLAAARLNANVVQAVTNDTNVTGSIATQNLTLAWSGTLAIARGGTGQSTATAAFNALSPMTTLGDVIYGGASGAGTRLAGNTTTTKKFLRQTGDGVNSAAPAWDTVVAGDVPTSNLVNGTLISMSGTLTSRLVGASDNVTVALSNGSAQYQVPVTGATPFTPAWTALSLASAQFANQGTTTTVLHGNAAGNPSWSAVSLTADVTGDLPFANIAQLAAYSVAANNTVGVGDIASLAMANLSVDGTALSISAGSGTRAVLSALTISHSTATGYKHVPSGGATTQLLQWSSDGTAKWVSMSSEATIADGGALTITKSITPTWTGLHTFNPGTTPTTAILLDIDAPGVAGTRDSNWLVWRGRSYDTVAHLAEWKTFVDVTSNAGASTFTLQSRIDAVAFANRLTVDDAGTVVAAAFEASSYIKPAVTANYALVTDASQKISGVTGSQYQVLQMGAVAPTFAAVQLAQAAATTGNLLNSRGGTGQDSSGWTGWVKVASGTWSASANVPFGDVNGLTSKSILFAGASGAISQDNALFQYDSVNVTAAIGTAATDSRALYVYRSGAKTTSQTSLAASNVATSSTASLSKFGLLLESSGVWNGAGSVNYGLYISDVSGGTTNWALYNNTSANVYLGSGNVSIGTTTPGRQFTLYGTTPIFQITNSTSGEGPSNGLEIQQSGLNSYIENNEVGSMFFRTSATDRITIDPSGNVGIGTTSPSKLLHVAADTGAIPVLDSGISVVFSKTAVAGNANFINILSGNTAKAGIYLGDTDDENQAEISFNNNGRFLHILNPAGSDTSGITINSSGLVGIGTTSPQALLHLAGSLMRIQLDDTSQTSPAGRMLIQSYNDQFQVWGRNAGDTGWTGPALVVNRTGNVGIETSGPTSSLAFGGEAARTIQLEARTSNAAGNNLTVIAGAAGAGATGFAGGSLYLKGANAAGTTGAANGGNVYLAGGSAINGGTQGFIQADSHLTFGSGYQCRLTDGTVGAPGLAFGAETSLGLWRTGAGALALASGSSSRLLISSAGVVQIPNLTASRIVQTDASSNLIAQNTIPGDANSSLVKGRWFNVGDAVNATITVTHNYNTYDVDVIVVENTSDRKTCPIISVKRNGLNSVDIEFPFVPASNAYRALVTSLM